MVIRLRSFCLQFVARISQSPRSRRPSPGCGCRCVLALFIPNNRGWTEWSEKDEKHRIGEMAMVGDGSAMLGNVHSPYIRGEALFRAGSVKEGIAEFQKIVDHPGIRFTE